MHVGSVERSNSESRKVRLTCNNNNKKKKKKKKKKEKKKKKKNYRLKPLTTFQGK